MWKSTKALGIGLAASKEPDGRICSYVVARYFKAGNDLATIRSNVARGMFRSCNHPTQNTHPTTGYSMPRKKHRGPTRTYKITPHHLSTYTQKHFTTRPSHSRFRTSRKHGRMEPRLEGALSVRAQEYSKAFMGKSNNHYLNLGRPGSDGSKVYKVNPEKLGKGVAMFANEGRYANGVSNSYDGISTKQGRVSFMDTVRESPSPWHFKTYAPTGTTRLNGKNKFHMAVKPFSTASSSPKKSYKSFGPENAISLFKEPINGEFGSGYHISKHTRGRNVGGKQFDAPSAIQQDKLAFENSLQTPGKGNRGGSTMLYQGNVHGNRERGSLKPEGYPKVDSSNEFYFGASHMHKPLQSQIVKPKDVNRKVQFGSMKNEHYLEATDQSKELLPPAVTSFHRKQQSISSNTSAGGLTNQKNLHKENDFKEIQKEASQEEPHLRPKQEEQFSQHSSKTEDKQSYQSALTSLSDQHHEKMADKEDKNGVENMLHSSNSKFENEYSEFALEANRGRKQSFHSHRGAHRFHSETHFAPNEIQSKRPHYDSSSQVPALTHQKANVKFGAGSIKTDAGFLTGVNAALSMERNADAHEFYDEPVGALDSSSKVYAGIGSVQDFPNNANEGNFVPRGQTESQIDLNSLREEGTKIEASLTDAGAKNSDRSFEEGLIKSVTQGKADIFVQKRPEDYKMPSVLMDEYRYDTPENGREGNIYESLAQQLGESKAKIPKNGKYLNSQNNANKEKGSWRGDSQKLGTNGSTKQENSIDSVQSSMLANQFTKKFSNASDINGQVERKLAADLYIENKLHGKGGAVKDTSFRSSNKPSGDVPGLVREKSRLAFHSSFKSGFEDALSAFGGVDDGKVVDVQATKKEVLSMIPTHKKDRYKASSGNGKKKDAIQFNDEKGYDTSRARHFVIDKSNNLVLTPGEETGSITDYETKHLADLTHQVTYGVNNVAKMFKEDDLTGLNSLKKIIPDQNDLQSGVIAWSGPYNPGLPSEEEVKQQSDLSGHDLVEKLEKPNDFRMKPFLNQGSDTNSRFIQNSTLFGDIISKFHDDFRNGSLNEDELGERLDKNEKKFFKFRGKTFDDDMKLLTEKDLEDNESPATKTQEEGM